MSYTRQGPWSQGAPFTAPQASAMDAGIPGVLHAVAATSGSVTIDLADGDVQTLDLAGNASLSFGGFTDGQYGELLLMLTPGSNAVTWPSGVKWIGGGLPALSTGLNLIRLVSIDGAATMLGDYVGNFDLMLPPIGDALMTGFYAGIMDTTKGNIIAADASQTGLRYALIVAPKSLESSLQYKTANSAAPAACSTRWDGLTATAAMASATYPAAQYCAGLTHDADGASGWYMPAMDELELIYRHLKPTTESNYTTATTGSTFPGTSQSPGYNPSSDPTGSAYTSSVPGQTSVAAFQSGGAQALGASGTNTLFWTATEYNANSTWLQYATGSGTYAGDQIYNNKTASEKVRPVRRFVISEAS